MGITRRIFLRNGVLAVVGTAAVPSFLTRAALGAGGSNTHNKRLVVIFQRGAADGLNIVVPHGEQQYYAMRPNINIPHKAVLDLDGDHHSAPLPGKKAGEPDSCGDDCDDTNAAAHPGGTEICDKPTGWINAARNTREDHDGAPSGVAWRNSSRGVHAGCPVTTLRRSKHTI